MFFRLWKNGGWWDIQHPARFFRGAGRNEALNVLRHRSVRALDLKGQLAERIGDPAPLPDKLLERAERREIAERIISRLPPRCGLVCTLVFLRGFTHKEVGERLGISHKAVEKQVARGRRLIRAMPSPLRPAGRVLATRKDGGIAASDVS